MAVIPGGSHPVPDGAKKSGADLALIQNLTESDVRNQIKSQALLPWQSAHGSFFTNIIGGIGQALIQGITGVANTIGGWVSDFFTAGRKAMYGTTEITDGQLNLADRADLVDTLLNYGSAFCPAPRDGAAIGKGTMRLPFTEMIGYSRNVSIAEGGGLVLEKKGTWDLSLSVNTGFVRFNSGVLDATYRNGLRIELSVYRPNGTLYSRESKWVPSEDRVSAIAVATVHEMRPTNVTIVSSVQVPGEGYIVRAEVADSESRRPILGGPRWSRMRAQNISSEWLPDRGTGGEESSNVENPGTTETAG